MSPCMLRGHARYSIVRVVTHVMQLVAAEINKLRDHVESLGGQLGDGWSATLKLRTAGQRAGQYDVYFYAPDGAMYRSKACLFNPSPSLTKTMSSQVLVKSTAILLVLKHDYHGDQGSLTRRQHSSCKCMLPTCKRLRHK